ncbi:MAG: hypothetical protein K5773_00235 [Pseudobutyrivibrio sp.]|nr:hypothetical protein [Pseudobutyrivibrio sp.]
MKLQFYKKGIPTRIIKRVALLATTFLVSVVFFEIVTNVHQAMEVSAQESPTLPIVMVSYLGENNTLLHGYVNEMDPAYMRDAIIPLFDDRNVSLTINCYDYQVDKVSYEIRSLDSDRNISSNDLDFTQKGKIINVDFTAENLIEAGEEYLLVITITSGEDQVYYYTRIMQSEGYHEKEILDFARYFHNTALSADPGPLATYIEPSGNSSYDLSHVTINSSLDQISYGTFDGSATGSCYVSMTDISSNYISLTFSYMLSRQVNDTSEYYQCFESFRIRYTSDRLYLLNYDRTMTQLLDEDAIDIKLNAVNIGISDPDVQYLSNETGTIVSFVSNGSLYEYNQTQRTIKEIFNFVSSPEDPRATYNQHQILILNIDESGTMDYVVYGYMNSGRHEGQCGINLYHFDALENISTEQVFIPSSSSYQILNANFSQLLYETADNEFYIMVSGTLLHIDLNMLTTEELITGLDEDQYAVSNSGRYMAWMENPIVSDCIHIKDLETGKSHDIEASAGQLLKPLAFMEDDMIYGVLDEDSIITDEAGTTVYPMHALTISDVTGEKDRELMTYSKPGYFVTDIKLEGYTIYLNRIQIGPDGIITEASEDTIKNSAGEQNKAVPITTQIDAIKQQVVLLNMAEFEEGEKLGKVKYDVTGLVLADGSRSISVSPSATSTQYFVYVGNTVTLATDNLLEAITEADENMGIVLDNEPSYIWKRGRKSYVASATNMAVGSNDSEASGTARALSAMLVHEGENVQVHSLIESGETPISILSRTLKNYNILDLTGATLTETLYYVNLGNPVYAYTGEDTAVLIVGYDSSTVTIFDPLTLKNSKMSINEATTYFETFGNVFVSYIH